MNSSDLKKACAAFVTLYGIIFSAEAFEILKNYFPDLKESELNDELGKILHEESEHYLVRRATKRGFIIHDPYFDDKDIEELLEQQMDKPFFFPNTFEELISFNKNRDNFLDDDKIIDDFEQFIIKNSSRKRLTIAMKGILLLLKLYSEAENGGFERKVKLAERLEININNKEVLNEFIMHVNNIHNHTKMRENRGYSPNELSNIIGHREPSDIQLGEGLLNMLNEIGDLQDLIDEIEKTDMPDNIKESLINQIKTVKNNKEKISA